VIDDVAPAVIAVAPPAAPEPLTAAEKHAAYVARISIVRSFEGAAVARFARERARRKAPLFASYRCGDVRWTAVPRSRPSAPGGVP